jgi:signal transduction histidine kinase
MNSFRLRLALLVGGSAAALLLAAGFFAWQLTTRFNMDRVDRELRHIGKSNLESVEDHSHWGRVDNALAFVSGTGRPPSYVLWVRNYDVEEYRSSRWPAGIDPLSLPMPASLSEDAALKRPEPPPPRPGENPPPRPGEDRPRRRAALPTKQAVFSTIEASGSTWRVGVMGNPHTTLVLAVNLDELNVDLQQLRRSYLAALPLALLLLGGGAWFLASRALRPVETLTQAAERINTRGLDQRIAAPVHDREFQRLVTVFNAMMDRLEQGFHQARRFSADASHELKTPLALLQAEIEQALHAAPAGSSQQQTYTSLLEEIHHLRAILDKLLLLSLADSGRLALQRESADLSRIVIDLLEDCAALAPNLELEQDLRSGIAVQADAVLLEQALQNLINNAVKYNREGGRIRVTLRSEAGLAVVSFGNTGQRIAEADKARVFERFYRGDPARSRDRGSGAGLGLSLSREILRAHGGELALTQAREDWTEFTATVPLGS